MNYFCKINKIVEELEVVLDISGNVIKGLDIHGTLRSEGEECFVEMIFFDDITISESNATQPCIVSGKGFEHSFIGILDFENKTVKSMIDIELEEEELYESGYLDGKMVKVDVKRIDFIFLGD